MFQVTIVPLKPFERAMNPASEDVLTNGHVSKLIGYRSDREGRRAELARHPRRSQRTDFLGKTMLQRRGKLISSPAETRMEKQD
jgi:hypothetical protein